MCKSTYRRLILAKARMTNASQKTFLDSYRHTRSLNFDMAADIMVEMWKRGFDTEITDILRIERPPSLAPKKSRADDPWTPPPLTRRQHQKYPGEEFVRAYVEEGSP